MVNIETKCYGRQGNKGKNERLLLVSKIVRYEPVGEDELKNEDYLIVRKT